MRREKPRRGGRRAAVRPFAAAVLLLSCGVVATPSAERPNPFGIDGERDHLGLGEGVRRMAVEAEEGSVGLNAATGDIEDLLKKGITDPAKVTRAAMQNASSIAALLLTTEAVVADAPEEGGGGMPAGMPDMGGMGGMM